MFSRICRLALYSILILESKSYESFGTTTSYEEEKECLSLQSKDVKDQNAASPASKVVILGLGVQTAERLLGYSLCIETSKIVVRAESCIFMWFCEKRLAIFIDFLRLMRKCTMSLARSRVYNCSSSLVLFLCVCRNLYVL